MRKSGTKATEGLLLATLTHHGHVLGKRWNKHDIIFLLITIALETWLCRRLHVKKVSVMIPVNSIDKIHVGLMVQCTSISRLPISRQGTD